MRQTVTEGTWVCERKACIICKQHFSISRNHLMVVKVLLKCAIRFSISLVHISEFLYANLSFTCIRCVHLLKNWHSIFNVLFWDKRPVIQRWWREGQISAKPPNIYKSSALNWIQQGMRENENDRVQGKKQQGTRGKGEKATGTVVRLNSRTFANMAAVSRECGYSVTTVAIGWFAHVSFTNCGCVFFSALMNEEWFVVRSHSNRMSIECPHNWRLFRTTFDPSVIQKFHQSSLTAFKHPKWGSEYDKSHFHVCDL